MTNTNLTYKTNIAAAFSKAAATYDDAAIIEQEIGARLLDRLNYLPIQPKYILDLGSGTGFFTQQLQILFPNAIIIGIDIAFGMTNFATQKTALTFCCADAEHLPFANLQFDLIFSNCCLPSVQDFSPFFLEIKRVLNNNGVLLFTTFGPDTLNALGLENQWPDMHIIADLLLHQGYVNTVVDVEHLTFTYQTLKALLTDLQNTGSFIIDLDQIENLYTQCSANIEVIYGQTIKDTKNIKQHKDPSGKVYVPLDQITYLNK